MAFAGIQNVSFLRFVIFAAINASMAPVYICWCTGRRLVIHTNEVTVASSTLRFLVAEGLPCLGSKWSKTASLA